MTLKDVLTKEYSLNDISSLLRSDKFLKRTKLRFVSMSNTASASADEQNVVALPLRTLALQPFSFPFGRKVSVRDTLELQFRPLLGAKAGGLNLVPQITAQKPNETSGIAWFVSKDEIEQCEKRFENCVIWPAPYLFGGRVGGNGIVICEYDDCSCGMFFAENQPKHYGWLSKNDGTAQDLADRIAEIAKTVLPNSDFNTCIVKPEEITNLQQTGDTTVALYPSAATLNLSLSTSSADAESEKRAAAFSRYTELFSLIGIIFLALSFALLFVNIATRKSFTEAPHAIYKTVFGESSENPLSSVLQKLRSVSADKNDSSFEQHYSRIASAWKALSQHPKIDELRYGTDKIQLVGSTSDASVIDAFKKALTDTGYSVIMDNVQKIQKGGMHFTISLTEGKTK